MDYFSKERTFAAYLRKVDCKNKKGKQSEATNGGDAPVRLMCILALDVPLTKPMRTSMSKPVQAWIASSIDAKNSEGLDKAIPAKQKPFFAVVNLFETGEKKEVELTPNESGDRVSCHVSLKNYYIQEGEAFARIQVMMRWEPKLWAWLGPKQQHDKNGFDMTLRPLQKSLEFGSEMEEDDEEEGEE
jgi:hypothetical protein